MTPVITFYLGSFGIAELQLFVAVAVLAVLWTLETLIPFVRNRKQRLRHSGRNLAFGLVNSVLLAFLFVPILYVITDWTRENNFGLLNLAGLSPLTKALIALLLLDFWNYLWHRANHQIPLLWRFHRVHHSDADMDASTAVRIHPGEMLLSIVLRLAFAVGTGVSFWHVLLYDVLLLPVILLHHSNVRFPDSIDSIYRLLFSSPAMHRIHHSPVKAEHDSNYGSILSVWDRIARTFKMGEMRMEYGLRALGQSRSERLRYLLLLPFKAMRE